MANWAQFGDFHLGVYSLLLPAVQTLMAVCWVILRGQEIYSVIQATLSLLYIVANCHFFSVVSWKDIKYLQKCEGCAHFCEIQYIFTDIVGQQMCWYEVRALPRAKKAVFWSGDKEAYNTAGARLKARIKGAKRRHQQRLERDLNTNSTNSLWQVIQNVTGHKSRSAPFMCEAIFTPSGQAYVSNHGGCEKNLNSKTTPQRGLWLI